MTHADNSLPELHPADGPWSIYLHVPFCASRCGYCDFNTYVLSAMGDDAVAGYLDAAHQELELAADALGDAQPPVSTIFFGGGTPTMLSPVQLGELIDHIRTLWGIDPDAEVTTEANPETLSVEVLAGLLKAGINRLSMGMQSADEYVLTVLDRRHWPGRAVEMAQLARQVGFDDVSLDLIFGAPGENFDSWRHSLDVTLTAEPDHISAYSLSFFVVTRLRLQPRFGRLLRVRCAVGGMFLSLQFATLDRTGHRDVISHHLTRIAQLTSGRGNRDPTSRSCGARGAFVHRASSGLTWDRRRAETRTTPVITDHVDPTGHVALIITGTYRPWQPSSS